MSVLLRIFASIIILFSVLFMPFWVSAILGLVAMSYYSFFFEVVFLFFISDLLFAATEPKFFNIVVVSSSMALLFLIGLELLKKKLRLQPIR